MTLESGLVADVLLVGTGHPFQYGAASRHPLFRTCTLEEERQFVAWIVQQARLHQANCIAEELNEEGLREARVTSSVPQRIAQERGLPHRFCDPDNAERKAAGILAASDVRAMALMEDSVAEKEIERRVRAHYAKREEIWLRRLMDVPRPVLFVCGADHVQSFSDLLALNSLHCRILHKHWRP